MSPGCGFQWEGEKRGDGGLDQGDEDKRGKELEERGLKKKSSEGMEFHPIAS